MQDDLVPVPHVDAMVLSLLYSTVRMTLAAAAAAAAAAYPFVS
jgi:hypothetical protein